MRNVLFVFGQLTDEDVDWLAAAGQRLGVAGGSPLITEGEPIEAVYLLLAGEVTVSRRGLGELARLGPGELLGEMSFVDASPPSASVVAAGEAVVLRVPRESLERRLAEAPAFAARFFRAMAMMLSDRLRSVELARGAKPGALEPGELDPNVLDGVSLAGERFDRLARRLATAPTPAQPARRH